MAPRVPAPKELGDLEPSVGKLTHYLFRYPAKFHAPVVRTLLERFTEPGETVLDPFCGSGTLMVEALTMGRNSVGIDVDPVAVEVSRAKSTTADGHEVELAVKQLLELLKAQNRGAEWYAAHDLVDLDETAYQAELAEADLWVPAIPKIEHWFRRYVIIDLANIRAAIANLDVVDEVRTVLRIVFASIIRNASNADPVPVSGLEVTHYMKQRDAKGRVVDPYALFAQAAAKARVALDDLARHRAGDTTVDVAIGDATEIKLTRPVTAVITSPPYHNAVDYYRRHTLEMYWLGHVLSHADRLALLPKYVGRPHIPVKHPLLAAPTELGSLAAKWERDMLDAGSTERARDFRHYMVAMTRVFEGLADGLSPNAPVVMVVGHSAWNGDEIPTGLLLQECAGSSFELDEQLFYAVKNRYMSYSRRNSANIDREYVLVFRRT